jgi:hypothetical protein
MTPTRCEISIFISPLTSSLAETEILWRSVSVERNPFGPKHTDSLFKVAEKKAGSYLSRIITLGGDLCES